MAASGPSSSSGSGSSGGGGGGGSDAGSFGDGVYYRELLPAAAVRGSLPLVAYLHSQLQCPLEPAVLQEEAGSGCEALVEWLQRHGCALPEDTVALLLEPAKRGDLATLRCLRRLGVPWPRGLLPEAVRRDCPLPMLRWLVAEGVPVDAARSQRALRERRGAVAETTSS